MHKYSYSRYKDLSDFSWYEKFIYFFLNHIINNVLIQAFVLSLILGIGGAWLASTYDLYTVLTVLLGAATLMVPIVLAIIGGSLDGVGCALGSLSLGSFLLLNIVFHSTFHFFF